jgi:hypothetical protein
MQDSTWQPLPAAEKVDILRRLNSIEPACHFNPDETAADFLPLTFYPQGRLLRVIKNISGSAPLWYAYLASEIVPLDGSIANIHHANAEAPLTLDAENIEDYLAFRLYFADKTVLKRARAELYNNEWTATVQMQSHDGTYEAKLMITTRGEVTETHVEKRSNDGYESLPAFHSTQA